MNLKQAAWFSATPWGFMALSGYVAGVSSDFLIRTGHPVTRARKIMQVNSFDVFWYFFDKWLGKMCVVSVMCIMIHLVDMRMAVYWFSWTRSLSFVLAVCPNANSSSNSIDRGPELEFFQPSRFPSQYAGKITEFLCFYSLFKWPLTSKSIETCNKLNLQPKPTKFY